MDTGSLFILSVLICFVHPERKFVFVNKYLNWTSAQTYCRESFTDLVTVQDEQENQKLMELAEDLNECVWIGLRHTLHNWKWSKGVPSRSYDQNDDIWADGQPDNDGGGEHCAGISVTSLKGFNDKECTTALPFICFDDKAVLKYIIVEELETWDDAQIYCRTTHDDLATVTKETLLLLVSQLMLTGQREAWIGLYRDPWSSWSDSTSTSFNKWETDPTIHPTDDSCGCLKADTGLWQDISCDTGNQFFCYQDLRQTVLKVKLQSAVDLNNMEMQQQILEQIQDRLEAVGVTNITVKWRATAQNSNPEELVTN